MGYDVHTANNMASNIEQETWEIAKAAFPGRHITVRCHVLPNKDSYSVDVWITATKPFKDAKEGDDPLTPIYQGSFVIDCSAEDLSRYKIYDNAYGAVHAMRARMAEDEAPSESLAGWKLEWGGFERLEDPDFDPVKEAEVDAIMKELVGHG